MIHAHYSTGEPCDCGFTKHLGLERTAGLTPNQKMRAIEEAGPDNSQRVYDYPDNWTIHQMMTPEDAVREGILMRNCWQDPIGPNYNEVAPNGYAKYRTLDEYMPNKHWLSLRDQYGYPQAAFHLDGDYINHALGHGNSPLKPEHQQRLMEFANANGYDYPENWGRLSMKTAIAPPPDPRYMIYEDTELPPEQTLQEFAHESRPAQCENCGRAMYLHGDEQPLCKQCKRHELEGQGDWTIHSPADVQWNFEPTGA